MPPWGLYQMPRNHLYGGMTRPRVFNTKDFQGSVDEAAGAKPTFPAMDGAIGSLSAAVGAEKKKANKAAKKEKKRQSLDKNDQLERTLRDSVERAGGDVSSKKKKDKKKGRHSEGAVSDVGEVPPHTPVAPPSGQKSQKQTAEKKRPSAKKRKRESEAHADAANTQLLNEAYLANQKLPSLVLESLRGFSSPATQPQQTPATDQPSKKKTKTKRKSDIGGTGANDTKSKGKNGADVPIIDLKSTKHASVPSDWVNGSDEKSVKKQKNMQAVVAQKPSPATPSSVLPVKKTPVPFPQLSQKIFSPTDKIQRKNVGEDYMNANILVPETPPSKAPSKTYVPVPQNNTNGTAASGKVSKQKAQAVDSSPTPAGGFPLLSSAPVVPAKSQVVSKLPSIPNALTDANLRSFKEPLNEESKPRPLTKSGASTTTSVRTSSASMSIQEAFARVGKPYMRSAVENDPFTLTDAKPKKSSQHREEASLEVFKEKYHEVEKAVDWASEATYLEAHIEWDLAHGSVEPTCLHKMTGCTHKKEDLIRQSKEQNMPILSQIDTSEADFKKFCNAVSEATRAEDLLMLAIKARIPVPLGRISGRWTLYCPTYTACHYDKYGYGARTLIISSIAGFRSNSYTARLQLPPRTMSFTLMMFTAPPHASFRGTVIKTASEGYTMEVVFMGNGYLHLRLDLGLMLQGKSSDKTEGGGVMEFIGVHEKAVVWYGTTDGTDEVEEEGKKMFKKYDGE